MWDESESGRNSEATAQLPRCQLSPRGVEDAGPDARLGDLVLGVRRRLHATGGKRGSSSEPDLTTSSWESLTQRKASVAEWRGGKGEGTG